MKEAAKNGSSMWMKFIFDTMKEKEMSSYQLAKLSGVDQSTISKLRSCEQNNPRLQTVFCLLGALEWEKNKRSLDKVL